MSHPAAVSGAEMHRAAALRPARGDREKAHQGGGQGGGVLRGDRGLATQAQGCV